MFLVLQIQIAFRLPHQNVLRVYANVLVTKNALTMNLIFRYVLLIIVFKKHVQTILNVVPSQKPLNVKMENVTDVKVQLTSIAIL